MCGSYPQKTPLNKRSYRSKRRSSSWANVIFRLTKNGISCCGKIQCSSPENYSIARALRRLRSSIAVNLSIRSPGPEAARLGAVKRNYAAEGLAPQMSFGGWSMDSSRLLLKLEGAVQQLVPPFGYVYVNTRTRRFELTNYLRKINKAQTPALVCAEPVDQLPDESDWRARFAKLDRELNATYAAVLTKDVNKQFIPGAQRIWLKHRDEGAKIYSSVFPQRERESRRLQFLCDVTAIRIAMEPYEWAFQP